MRRATRARLFVRRLGAPGSAWRAFDADGRSRGEGTLDRLDVGDEPVMLLAPSPDARVDTVRLPAGSAAQLRRALPYAMEESLAGDLANVQLTQGERLPDGRHAVAIIAKRRLAGWLGSAVAANLRVAAIVPEVLCVPWSENDTVALDLGQRLLLRWGLSEGLAVDGFLAATVFQHLAGISADRPGGRVRWLSSASVPFDWPGATALNGWMPERVDVDRMLASGARSVPLGLDLLAGGDSRTGGAGAEDSRAWRRVAAVGATVGALLLADLWLDVRRLETVRDHWDAEARALYLSAFPGARGTGDIERLIRQRMAQGSVNVAGREASALPLLGAVGEQMREQRIRLDALRFDDSRLELDLVAPSIAEVEGWRTALAARSESLTVRTEGVVASGQGTRARLVVEPR